MSSRSTLLALLMTAVAGACGAESARQAGSGGAPGGVGGGNPLGGAPLMPLPTDQVGACVDNVGNGWHGKCCKFLTCFTPEAGPCPIPGPNVNDPIHWATGCRGGGSGACNCGAITGPFAPGDVPANCGAREGACCYLVPIQPCDGRPLRVEGVARVAALRVGDSGW